MKKKMNYFSLDIDDKKRGKEAIRLLRVVGCTGTYRVSSSGNGYHIRVHTKKSISKADNLKLRWMWGDDFGRFVADYRRMISNIDAFEVLFYHKNGRGTGRWYTI